MLAAFGLFLGLLPCAVAVSRGDSGQRLVALEIGGVLQALLLLVLAQALQQKVLVDLALAAALLSFGGGMVFVRFLEKRL